MPLPISVSPTPILYDIDLLWPYGTANRLGKGDAFDTTGLRGGAVQVAMWSAAVGAGVNTYDIDARGQLFAHFDSDGVGAVVSRQVDFFRIYAPLLATGLPAGYKNPSWYRVWRVQAVLRTAAAVAAVWSYFGFSVEAAAAAGVPSGTAPYFGLRGDGAGGWQYVCRNTVGAAVQESIGLGIAQTAYTVFDLVLLSASATAPAVFQIWANGVLVFVRTWAAGTLLPFYTAIANGSHLTPCVGANDAGVAVALQLGMVRCMAGRFQVDGAEV